VPLSLDSYLGASPDALKLSARRTEVLAANLANADTPNYKARDIDFRTAMAAAAGGSNADGLSLKTTNGSHIGPSSAASVDANARLLYRVPLAPSLDGNTVDPQLEQASFAQNAVRYQATLTFLNAKFRSLLTAITGQ
jgi:flagellar basal-body rod protein FlgB